METRPFNMDKSLQMERIMGVLWGSHHNDQYLFSTHNTVICLPCIGVISSAPWSWPSAVCARGGEFQEYHLYRWEALAMSWSPTILAVSSLSSVSVSLHLCLDWKMSNKLGSESCLSHIQAVCPPTQFPHLHNGTGVVHTLEDGRELMHVATIAQYQACSK